MRSNISFYGKRKLLVQSLHAHANLTVQPAICESFDDNETEAEPRSGISSCHVPAMGFVAVTPLQSGTWQISSEASYARHRRDADLTWLWQSCVCSGLVRVCRASLEMETRSHKSSWRSSVPLLPPREAGARLFMYVPPFLLRDTRRR